MFSRVNRLMTTLKTSSKFYKEMDPTVELFYMNKEKNIHQFKEKRVYNRKVLGKIEQSIQFNYLCSVCGTIYDNSQKMGDLGQYHSEKDHIRTYNIVCKDCKKNK